MYGRWTISVNDGFKERHWLWNIEIDFCFSKQNKVGTIKENLNESILITKWFFPNHVRATLVCYRIDYQCIISFVRVYMYLCISGDYQQNGFFWSQSSKSPSMFAPRTTPQKPFYMNRKPASVPATFKTTSNTTSPNSSTSGSSSITPQRSHGRSASSKGSTTSTLTPSPSPTPGKVSYHQYLSGLSVLSIVFNLMIINVV